MVVSSRGTARLIGIGVSCAASVAVGLGLVFKLVTPESVAQLQTQELLGLLGLLVMPLGVLLLVRAHWPRSVPEAGIAASRPSVAPSRIVVLAPDVRDNSGDRHRRRRHAKSAHALARR